MSSWPLKLTCLAHLQPYQAIRAGRKCRAQGKNRTETVIAAILAFTSQSQSSFEKRMSALIIPREIKQAAESHRQAMNRMFLWSRNRIWSSQVPFQYSVLQPKQLMNLQVPTIQMTEAGNHISCIFIMHVNKVLFPWTQHIEWDLPLLTFPSLLFTLVLSSKQHSPFLSACLYILSLYDMFPLRNQVGRETPPTNWQLLLWTSWKTGGGCREGRKS